MRVIIAGALANKPMNGGEAWVRLSWIRAFQAIGAEVHFIEQISSATCTDAAGRPAAFQDSVNRRYFDDVTRAFGLAERAALIVDGSRASLPDSTADRTAAGLSRTEVRNSLRLVEEWAEYADLLVNISGHLTLPSILRLPAIRAYVDIDPGFTQFWLSQPETAFRIEPHDVHFTIGENIGRRGCSIPDGGIRWLPTRQPVVLADWPLTPPDPERAFTTIASWRGAFGPVEFGGRRFGLKVHEFRRFAGLPSMTRERLRIALDIHAADHADHEMLVENGWQLDDPRVVAKGPAEFRRYITTSKGEFSVAQGIYVDTASGWFSDRTTRYLAASRPAVVQDTGFGRQIPVGDGLIAFDTPASAAAVLDSVARDLDHHGRAARQIAEEFFDARTVVTRLLDDADAFRPAKHAKGPHTGRPAEYARTVRAHESEQPATRDAQVTHPRSVNARRRLRILVSGMIAGVPDQGGAAWAVLQYVLGLLRLGHDVVFVEALDDDAIRPAGAPLAASLNAATLDAIGSAFGIADRLAIVHAGTRHSHGIGYDDLQSFAKTADVLINLSGLLREPDLFEPAATRIYVDLDPAFTQLWSTEQGIDMRFAGHTHFATVGLSIGSDDCSIPTCGLDWIPIVQPIVLDQWPVGSGIDRDALTGIANWRGYGSIDRAGVLYGQKAHSLRELIELPTKTTVPFQIALAIHPDEKRDLDALSANRWQLVDPQDIAASPGQYREFIRGSWAEFGVAKSGYVHSRCGWFSDRSVCYLASGRPVLAQDTGFPTHLPTGEGLLAFDTMESALESIESIRRDYPRHSRAARRIAELVFDSDTVLGGLLEQVGAA